MSPDRWTNVPAASADRWTNVRCPFHFYAYCAWRPWEPIPICLDCWLVRP